MSGDAVLAMPGLPALMRQALAASGLTGEPLLTPVG